MVTAIVMIQCETGKVHSVAEALVDLDGIAEVYSISGQYDLMVKCYLADGADIGHFVNESMQRLPGVKDTFTLVAYKAFS